MTFEDLRQIPVLFSSGIDYHMKQSPQVNLWVSSCLLEYFEGLQGNTSEEGQIANLRDLASGYGRYVTKWNRAEDSDARDNILIISYFNKDLPGDIEHNNTMVMFCDEY